jgi:hypothetical protein
VFLLALQPDADQSERDVASGGLGRVDDLPRRDRLPFRAEPALVGEVPDQAFDVDGRSLLADQLEPIEAVWRERKEVGKFTDTREALASHELHGVHTLPVAQV